MIEIKDLKRVCLKKNDVLVIQLPSLLNIKDKTKKLIKKMFPKNKIMFITEDIKMYIVGKEEVNNKVEKE